jgi:hypothetical protein
MCRAGGFALTYSGISAFILFVRCPLALYWMAAIWRYSSSAWNIFARLFHQHFGAGFISLISMR